MKVILFIIIIILIGSMFIIMDASKKDKKIKSKKNKLLEELKNIEGFTVLSKFMNKDSVIAISGMKKLIAIKDSLSNQIKVYKFSDLSSYDIIEDGETIYENKSVIGRAIIGGVIAGGVGAIIGGLSAKDKEYREIKNIDFRFKFNENKISYTIRFFDAKEVTYGTQKKVKLDNSTYGKTLQQAIKKVEYWKEEMDSILQIEKP